MQTTDNEIKLVEHDLCTGCGACVNICSQNAITLQEDDYGFVYPHINKEKCIHCGMCAKVCLSECIKNYPQNTYVLQSKDDNLSVKSSSGGMFAELARYFLHNNGVVFGCAMQKINDKFEIKHIFIEDEKDLYKLQGSKYVQSDIDYSYRYVKQFLTDNRLVLFSGTPCQIAGLKSFLNKNYENLLCVDLSCEGVPSQKLFNDYIKSFEKKCGQKIITFDFRNKKKMGWSCGNALITFLNKKQLIINNQSSPYLNLFLRGGIHRTSCYNCQFTGLKRVSDITIADAWGIESEYPELLKYKLNKDKGVSLVLINTDKGAKFFELLVNKLNFETINPKKMCKYNGPLRSPVYVDQTNMVYLEAYKKYGYTGLEKLFRQRLGWLYYYNCIKNHTPKFIKNIIKLFKTQQVQLDCLLHTMYGLSNYGSLLTAFALQKTITNLGYSCAIINYLNYFGYAKDFIGKYLILTRRCITNKDFVKLNNLCHTFILGSDNLINLPTSSLFFVARALLNYTQINKKRLMISGSMGSWDGTTETLEEHSYIESLLKRFDYLSTREEHGKEVIENKFACKADWINDPVFYLKKEDYMYFINNASEQYNNKIMQYILYPTDKTQKIVNYMSAKLNVPVVEFYGNENVKYFSKHLSVENWLSAILNSKLIITDSFHCVCFALIFNKPFVCVKNTHATVRFISLFKRLGVKCDLVENVGDLENYSFELDYNTINKNIEDIRTFALSSIEKQLLKSKRINKDDILKEKEFQKINKKNIEKLEPWFKRNRLFYIIVISLVVVPIKRFINDIKIQNN